MITNKEMVFAAACTNAMRAKGITFFEDFYIQHLGEIVLLQKKLAEDDTNFTFFGEKRGRMLLEYSIAMTYYNTLSPDEKEGIKIIAAQQYRDSSWVMSTWIVGLLVIAFLIVFLIAVVNKNQSKPSNSNKYTIPTSELSTLLKE